MTINMIGKHGIETFRHAGSSSALISFPYPARKMTQITGKPMPLLSLEVEFSRQEYWSGLPFPSPGDLPNPGFEPGSPALQAGSLPSESLGKL